MWGLPFAVAREHVGFGFVLGFQSPGEVSRNVYEGRGSANGRVPDDRH